MKRAIVTGISGQDGFYMQDYLSDHPDYEAVIGITRNGYKTEGYQCDLNDFEDTAKMIKEFRPHEIYHFAAASNPSESAVYPYEYLKANIDCTLNLLESIRQFSPETKMFHASSCLIFKPNTPYAVSKKASHDFVDLYRDLYKLNVMNGILYPHESPRRHTKYVSQKIVQWCKHPEDTLELGNIAIVRDWGHALDFIKNIHKSMQVEDLEDETFASGNLATLETFLDKCLLKAGFYSTGDYEKELNSTEKITKVVHKDNKTYNIIYDYIPDDRKLPKINICNKFVYENNIDDLIEWMFEDVNTTR